MSTVVITMMQILCILLDRVDRYIKEYHSTKYLALSCSNVKYEKNVDRIRYLIMLKSNILDVSFQKYTKIKFNLKVDLPLEKAFLMQNVVVLNRFVFNKNY